MQKIDFSKEYKFLYSASARKPTVVEVPRFKFLMYDGEGHPKENSDFQRAFEAIYGVAFTAKFMLKMGPAQLDFKVMPPEALFWIEGDESFAEARPKAWQWTVMIAVPDFVDGAAIRQARKQVKEKKGITSVDGVRLKTFREGKCIQIMHIGPWEKEGETIARLITYVSDEGYKAAGKHHEIYLSDPRRTAAGKLKTIVRLPVK